MQSLAGVTRINVLTAIRDHGLQGAGPFLEALGFEGPSDEVLVDRGRRYDARAVLAYAHGKATGECLLPEQVSLGSLQVLTDLGFEVGFRDEVPSAKQTPAARARARVPGTPKPRTPRAVVPKAPVRVEPEVKLCPSCFTQLPLLSGTCDYCD